MDSIVFLGLNFYAWITILTMLGIFVVMARTHIPAELAFSGAITILLVFGIVSEEEGGIRKRTRDCACGIFRGDGWIDAIRFFILANETFIGCPKNL